MAYPHIKCLCLTLKRRNLNFTIVNYIKMRFTGKRLSSLRLNLPGWHHASYQSCIS